VTRPPQTREQTIQPKEAGPFEEIARRLALSEISAAEALRHAARLAQQGELTAHRGDVLRLLAVSQAQAGRWQLAVQVHQVLLAAVDAAVPPVSAVLVRNAQTTWLEIASRALWECADPRLYHDAIGRGRAAFDTANAAGDAPYAAEIAFLIGALHLDAYVLHRGVHEHQATEQEWMRRLRAGKTWDGEHLPESPHGPFPAVKDAMRLAEEWLKGAVRLGGDPLRTLKALAAAMHARRQIEGSDAPPLDELAAVVRDAAAAFAGVDDPVRLVEVLAIGADSGVPLDRPRLLAAMAGPIEPLFDRYEVGDVLILLRNAARALRLDDAGEEAHALVVRATPAVLPRLRPRDLGDWYTTVCHAVRDRQKTPYATLAPGTGIANAWSQAIQEHMAGQWPVDALLTIALQLCEKSVATAEEAEAAAMVEQALERAPHLARAYGLPCAYLMALVLRRAAQLAIGDGRVDAGVQLGLAALLNAMVSEEPDVRLESLTDLSRSIGGASAAAVQLVGAFLQQHLARLEADLGEADAEVLFQLIGLACFAALKSGPAGFPVELMRLGKGYRFGAALRTGAIRSLVPDESTRYSHTLATDLLSAHPQADVEHRGRVERLRELLLTSPVVRSRVVAEGGSPAERLTNLRQRADTLFEAALARAAYGALAAAKGPDSPTIALDLETVILEFLLTRVENQEIVIRLATWAEGHHASATILPEGSAPGPHVIDGLVFHSRVTAELVMRARRAIQEDPPQDEVASKEALDALSTLADILLGDLQTLLPTLNQAGKRRLYLVPHGALHVAPLHLLPVDFVPLVDRWTVTFAPTWWLLAHQHDDIERDANVPARTLPVAALGMTFGGGEPFGLPALENVRAEVGAVTDALGGQSWLDGEVTEASLVAALRSARRVHIATHGIQDPTAPGYHTLFCTPHADDDGRLHARELIGLDLRGLELVTMSACETALGRFDFGDNLRGIPAMLLLGGVRTLIGCLWDIETRAAQVFFTALHRALGRGLSHADAFARAQAETRAACPQYRDWGAFYYLGR
jgi:CHAT domain-containing protein